MWRALIVLLIFEGALGAVAAPAQSLPSKKEMAALLEKAESQETFAAEGRAPFHILASVHNTIETHGKPAIEATGTYEILWQDPGRYREDFRLGMIWETDVANETELYIKRSAPYLSYSLWILRIMMNLPVRRPEFHKREKPKVLSVKAGNGNTVCAELAPPPGESEVCLDSTTNQAVSEHVRMPYGQSKFEYLFDDFVDFGQTRYARHIVFTEGGSTAEIKLEKLEPGETLAVDAFYPPPGATMRDWCPAPHQNVSFDSSVIDSYFAALVAWPDAVFSVLAGSSDIAYYDSQFAALVSGPDAIYSVLVGKDGSVEKMTQLLPDGSSKVHGGKALPWRFPAKDCSGKKIEYDTMQRVQRVPFRLGP